MAIYQFNPDLALGMFFLATLCIQMPMEQPINVLQNKWLWLLKPFRFGSGFVSGMIMPYAGSSSPSGWLTCYGQAVSRATYAALFAAIGTIHGAGDGSTHLMFPTFAGAQLPVRTTWAARLLTGLRISLVALMAIHLVRDWRRGDTYPHNRSNASTQSLWCRAAAVKTITRQAAALRKHR